MHAITFSLTNAFDVFKHDFSTIIGKWAGRAMTIFRHLPQHMQSAAVFTSANVAFFTLTYSLERHSEDRNRELNKTGLIVKGLGFGGAALIFNIILSKVTHDPLNKVALTAITIAVIAARLLLLSLCSKMKRFQQQNFMREFCNEIARYFEKSGEFAYVKFDDTQRANIQKFISQMTAGSAIIQDQSDICRATCTSIQAAFERILARKLKSGELKVVQVLFLNLLPCAPLRNTYKAIDATKSTEWKQWIVDIRTQTVRELRDAGAKLMISYSESHYQEFSAKNENEAECRVYALEKENENICEFPLQIEIAPEMRGTVYKFIDNRDVRLLIN
jgi:hypothetical protein